MGRGSGTYSPKYITSLAPCQPSQFALHGEGEKMAATQPVALSTAEVGLRRTRLSGARLSLGLLTRLPRLRILEARDVLLIPRWRNARTPHLGNEMRVSAGNGCLSSGANCFAARAAGRCRSWARSMRCCWQSSYAPVTKLPTRPLSALRGFSSYGNCDKVRDRR